MGASGACFLNDSPNSAALPRAALAKCTWYTSVRAASEGDGDADAGELLWASAIEVRTEVAARTERAIFMVTPLIEMESSSRTPYALSKRTPKAFNLPLLFAEREQWL